MYPSERFLIPAFTLGNGERYLSGYRGRVNLLWVIPVEFGWTE